GGFYQSVLRAELAHRYGVAWEPIVNGQAEIAGTRPSCWRPSRSAPPRSKRFSGEGSKPSVSERAVTRPAGSEQPSPARPPRTHARASPARLWPNSQTAGGTRPRHSVGAATA